MSRQNSFSYENFLSGGAYSQMISYFLNTLAPQGSLILLQKGSLLSDLDLGSIGVVISGSLNLKILSLSGQELSLYYLERGTIIGESEYFLGQKSTLTAEARQDTVISVIPAKLVRDILAQDSRLYAAFCQSLARKMNLLIFSLSDICFNDSTGRVASLILRQAYLRENQLKNNSNLSTPSNYFTHKELATRLNLNRVTVSKIISKLRKSGYIRNKGSRIEVLKPEGLKSLINSVGVEAVENGKDLPNNL